KEHVLLRHKTDLRAQMFLRHLANIHAVNQDAALVHVVEAGNQADQRRFARSGATYDGRDLTRTGMERYVAECRLFCAMVAKGHILELNISPLCVSLLRR